MNLIDWEELNHQLGYCDSIRTSKNLNLNECDIGVEGALVIAEAVECNSSLHWIHLYDIDILSGNLQLINQALQGYRNRRKQNDRLWMCTCIDHWRAKQRLNFDKLIACLHIPC
jgi:hypothetical protein